MFSTADSSTDVRESRHGDSKDRESQYLEGSSTGPHVTLSVHQSVRKSCHSSEPTTPAPPTHTALSQQTCLPERIEPPKTTTHQVQEDLDRILTEKQASQNTILSPSKIIADLRSMEERHSCRGVVELCTMYGVQDHHIAEHGCWAIKNLVSLLCWTIAAVNCQGQQQHGSLF